MVNERKEDLENAANEVIKKNSKFWVGVMVGASIVVALNVFYFIGKWIG